MDLQYRVLENGQVLIGNEIIPGLIVWTHYDDQYHIELEQIDGSVKARVFDYLGEKQLTKWVIEFSVDGGDPVEVETAYGVATIAAAAGKIEAKAPGARGASIELG